MTDHFELSTMTGTVAMSGSAAIRRRNRVIAATPSSIASSMFTSMSCAPLVTCSRAMSTASSSAPSATSRANLRDPVTFVRSPTLTNALPGGGMTSGSSPDSRVVPVGSGIWRGGRPATAAAIAATWAGVEPQQLPATLSRPCLAHSPSASAISSGVSS